MEEQATQDIYFLNEKLIINVEHMWCSESITKTSPCGLSEII